MLKIDRALAYAVDKHMGTYRKSTGVPFIIHPLEVLKQLRLWGITAEDEGCAALLHDTVEDTSATIEDIQNHFGDNVAQMVKDLTFTGIDKDAYLKSFKILPWTTHLIKIADRFCNVRDFLLTDAIYALKYFRKADDLFNSFFSRKDVSHKIRMMISEEHGKLYFEIGEGNAKHT